jgi:hypothetical protein
MLGRLQLASCPKEHAEAEMTARGERRRPDLLGDAQGFPVSRLGLAGFVGVRPGVDIAEDPKGVCLDMPLPLRAR